EQDQSSTYNIAKTKARLQNMDKTDREAYCELIKQKHKVDIHFECRSD
ncbi:unnamed protein product, partial [Rotaria magnacalcarata]